MTDSGAADSRLRVPLFPLPNVVLFPRAVLPLHIFEQRYRAMTADALAGSRLVAMALLRPGWEKCYYSRPAIEPVVCVGAILSHEKLPDGKYNFLLQGQQRARILSEKGGMPGSSTSYRVAELEPIPDQPAPEAALADEREALARLFRSGPLAHTTLCSMFSQLLAGTLSTPEIADLLAFSYFDDVALKQSLLAECCPVTRVRRTLTALRAIQARSWPSSPDANSANMN